MMNLGRYLPGIFLVFLLTCSGIGSCSAQLPYFPLGAPQVFVDPPAPWNFGQRVNFDITINRFQAIQRDANGQELYNQFLHGIGFDWGSCWTNITYDEAPPVRYEDEGFTGRWLVLENSIPISRCKSRIFPGFYFDGSRTTGDTRIALDNNPANNYGDGLRDRDVQGGWTFRWSAEVVTCPASNCDLKLQVFVLTDGETGSWAQVPPICAQGGQAPIDLQEGSIMAGGGLLAQGTACVGSLVDISCKNASASEIHSEWLVPKGEIVSESGNCNVQVRWQESGDQWVIRHRVGADGRRLCTDSLLVAILDLPQPRMAVDTTAICLGRNLGVRQVSTLTAGERYSWRVEPDGILITDVERNTKAYLWDKSGIKFIYLEAFDSVCNVSAYDSIGIRVDDPTFSNPFADMPVAICQTESFLLNENASIGVLSTYLFPGSTIEEWSGSGSHRVFYQEPGNYVALARQQRGTCIRDRFASIRVDKEIYISLPKSHLLCTPDSVILNASTYTNEFTYTSHFGSWSPSLFLSIPNRSLTSAFPVVDTEYTFTTSLGSCTAEATTFVKVRPSPSIISNPDFFIKCFDGDPISFEAECIGGLPPYRFEWTPNRSISNANELNVKFWPNQYTDYRVRVQDANGCTNDLLVSIAIDSVEVLRYDALQIRCSTDSEPLKLSLDVPSNASYVYNWFPPEGLSCTDCASPFVLDTVSRILFVEIRDTVRGCERIVGPFEVIFQRAQKAYAGPDSISICLGDSIRLGEARAVAAGTQLTWFPTQGLSNSGVLRPLAFPETTTTYILGVETDGCPTAFDTTTVHVVPPLDILYTWDALDMCDGDSVLLSLSGDLFRPDLRVRWRPGVDSSDLSIINRWVSPERTTVFYAEISGVACPPKNMGEILVTVNALPAIEIGSDSILICNGAKEFTETMPVRVVDSKSYAFSWLPAIGLSNASIANPLIESELPTVYRLTTRDPATGCTRTDSIWVGIGPRVTATVSYSDTTICRGDSVYAEASGGIGSASFNWTPKKYVSCPPCLNVFLLPDSSTTFTVYAEEGGCIDSTKVFIRVVARPIVDFQPTPALGCAPLLVTMAEYGQDIRSWAWDFGDETYGFGPSPQHTYTQPGRYLVKLSATATEGICNLESKDTEKWVEVLEPPAAGILLSFSDQDTLWQDGPAIQIRASTQGVEFWEWSFGDGGTAAGPSVSHRWNQSGEYIVHLLVSNSAGCQDTMSKRLIIWPSELKEIPNVFTPNGDDINEFWQPITSSSSPIEITVYDRWGLRQYQGLNQWDGNSESGNPAPEGSYLYLLRWNGRVWRGHITLIR